jgi:hypothetical protein
MELELREELDLVQAKVREAERARNTAYEIIADHEATIQKFRSLVSQVNYLDQLLEQFGSTCNNFKWPSRLHVFVRCHDAQHDDIQHGDIQHNNTQQNNDQPLF